MVWWRGIRFFALSLLASQVGITGCLAQPRTCPACSENVPGANLQTDCAGLVSATGEPDSIARAQKSDKPSPPMSMLELGQADPGSRDTRGARIRAVVNGEAILDEEVQAAAYQGLVAARDDKEKAEILNAKLNELIDREVILQDAAARLSKNERFLKELKRIAAKEFDKDWLNKMMRNNKFTDVDKFKRFLQSNGMSLHLIRRQWERNFMAMEYLRSRIEPQMNKVGHLNIVEYYDRHVADFRVEDNLTWQDIFITAGAPHPSREAASQFTDALLARIRKGEDFYRLAKEYDNGDSHYREDSEGVGHKHGEIRPPALEECLFRMKEGESVRVDMEHGFHIVKVVKRQYAGKRPFDEKVQKQIKDKLRGEIFQQEMKRIVADLKRYAVIEVANEIK